MLGIGRAALGFGRWVLVVGRNGWTRVSVKPAILDWLNVIYGSLGQDEVSRLIVLCHPGDRQAIQADRQKD